MSTDSDFSRHSAEATLVSCVDSFAKHSYHFHVNALCSTKVQGAFDMFYNELREVNWT